MKGSAKGSNGVLVLPPHYVQLAAALGLSTQSMLDPVSARTDFERLIELNRVQQIAQKADVKIEFDNRTIDSAQVSDTSHASNSANVSESNKMTQDFSKNTTNMSSEMDVDANESGIEKRSLKAVCSRIKEMNVLQDRVKEYKDQEMQALKESTEQNQNNQNIINQQEPRQVDDNMWRPW